MMKNHKKIIILIITVIIITIAIMMFPDKINQLLFEKNIENNFQENSQKNSQKLTLIINNGSGTQNIEADFKEGITALDLLKEETKKYNILLKTKNYDMGIFIEAIGDKENGQDGKYWLYYINGEMPPVAADKKELKSEDKVEFKFEKSPF